MSEDIKPEALSYYTTCGVCAEEGKEVVLEGVGEYYREDNTLYALPCPECGNEGEFQGWLDECDECGEFHYESEDCEEAN